MVFLRTSECAAYYNVVDHQKEKVWSYWTILATSWARIDFEIFDKSIHHQSLESISSMLQLRTDSRHFCSTSFAPQLVNSELLFHLKILPFHVMHLANGTNCCIAQVGDANSNTIFKQSLLFFTCLWTVVSLFIVMIVPKCIGTKNRHFLLLYLWGTWEHVGWMIICCGQFWSTSICNYCISFYKHTYTNWSLLEWCANK